MSDTNTPGGGVVEATSFNVGPISIDPSTCTTTSDDDQLRAQRESLTRQREQWNAYERRSTQDVQEQSRQLSESQAEFARRQARDLERLGRQRADFTRQRDQWNAYEQNQENRRRQPSAKSHSDRRLVHMTDLCDELQALIQELNQTTDPTNPQETN